MFTINIQAQTIEELRRKVFDLSSAISTIINSVVVADEPPVAEEQEEPKPAKVAKPRKKAEPEHISIEDLQALCVATAAVVGNPAVKAMIAGYNAGGIKAMTDEQRDELAAKLSNRHE
jgi:hypothetical protein